MTRFARSAARLALPVSYNCLKYLFLLSYVLSSNSYSTTGSF